MNDEHVAVGVIHHLRGDGSEDSIETVISVAAEYNQVDIELSRDIENTSPRISLDDDGRSKERVRSFFHEGVELRSCFAVELLFQMVRVTVGGSWNLWGHRQNPHEKELRFQFLRKCDRRLEYQRRSS